ncbi:MAG: signal peptidase I [Deltaproteobacteria bacterium]|jgi:signal peptidase I|nr:signal peptidase I [Deltaproteobacteria bacterium]
MSDIIEQERPPLPPKKKSIFREYAEALLVALILALVIRSFIVQAFKIPSGSMLETLQIGDHLLVNKFLYGLKWPFSDRYVIQGIDPERGDIVVFKYPNNPGIDYIKRIVGLPGDVVEIRNKQLIRNGQPVSESYIKLSQSALMLPVRDNYGPVTVPQGQYFVMGDNRDDSQDSRFWGFVSRPAMHGKAWRIYWSSEGLGNVRWSRFGKLVE